MTIGEVWRGFSRLAARLIAAAAVGCLPTTAAVGAEPAAGAAEKAAEPAMTEPAGATLEALRAMAAQAPVIFIGEVESVTGSGGGALPGVVTVRFAVEDAVRGVRGGEFLMREWGGAAGATEYRVGARYLMLLHAAGASGLSSPVGGADGAVPLLAANGEGEGEAVADLRWVATRAPVRVAYRRMERAETTAGAAAGWADGGLAGAGGDAVIGSGLGVGDGARDSSGAGAAAPGGHRAAERISTTRVVAALRRWEAQSEAMR